MAALLEHVGDLDVEADAEVGGSLLLPELEAAVGPEEEVVDDLLGVLAQGALAGLLGQQTRPPIRICPSRLPSVPGGAGR